MHGLITTANGPVTLLTANLPVELEDAKLQIKSHSDLDDDLVTDWIKAALQDFEEATGHQVMLARREYWLDAFPCIDSRNNPTAKIELPFPKLVEVESVQYINADGELVEFSDGASPETVYWQAKYPDGVPAQRGWVEPKYGYSWPYPRVEAAAVRITFTCGYGEESADLPALIKAALRFTVTDWNRFRGGAQTGNGPIAMPTGVEHILRKFKYAALQTIVPRSTL